jgi:hypothetical protein
MSAFLRVRWILGILGILGIGDFVGEDSFATLAPRLAAES